MRREDRIRLHGPALRTGFARRRGFALMEVIVAFAVLALGLGALGTGIVIALRSDGRLHGKRALDLVAESRLEAAGYTSPLKIGRREGSVGRYRWQETVTAIELGKKPRSETQATSNPAVMPVWVEVVVQGDGLETRLAALKLSGGAMP